MPETFWIEEYRKKAALPDAVSQTGRGNTFDAVGFLYIVKQAVELLNVRPEHTVVDVGCANGLLDIVLSACCQKLIAVEPVAELASKAKGNLGGCDNVEVSVGHAAQLPIDSSSVDRVLMMGVLQLIAPTEIPVIFAELRRVLRPGGRVLLGTIPDKRKQHEFLEPYLAGVQQATHLSDEQKNVIITRNRNAYWYDAEDLCEQWRALGATAKRCPLNPNDPDAAQRYHLLVQIPSEARTTALAS